MIIQCEQCSTKFRLDDSRVTDKGVKVRCAKCRHVFTVTKEPVETEAQPDLDAMFSQSQPDFGAMLDQHTALGSEEPAAPPEVPAADAGFDYSDFVSHDFAEQGVSPEGGGFNAVISGHTHQAEQWERNGLLYLNPGSAGPRRFRLPVTLALLEVDQEPWKVEIVELLPGNVED